MWIIFGGKEMKFLVPQNLLAWENAANISSMSDLLEFMDMQNLDVIFCFLIHFF